LSEYAGSPQSDDCAGASLPGAKLATRIAAKKIGVTMPFEKLTSNHLSRLLGEALNNAVYRENQRKLQGVIAKTNGLSMAADIVERSFGVPKSQPDRYSQSV
jgi:UDP:flavonoid glycosyltransferase YjiC (YdhE family)